MEIISTFILDRNCANLHAPTTKPALPMAKDIPVSARIPAFKERHVVKVHFLCEVGNQKIPVNSKQQSDFQGLSEPFTNSERRELKALAQFHSV